jgi:cysteine desulfurase
MFKKRRIYLDSAAGLEGNPSSPHAEGRAAREALERARRVIAELTEVRSDDILFTSGATESNALAILGSVRARQGARHVLYLPSAHASSVENVMRLKVEGVVCEALRVREGRVDIDVLRKQLRAETVLITMEAVCGETGTIWNTREVSALIQSQSRKNAAGSAPAARPILHPAPATSSPLLHVDASQAPWTEKITRSHFGGDLVTFDGAKVGVPGTGVLIASRPIPLQPLYGGGVQERGVRPGSQNVPGVVALAAALRAAAKGREAFAPRASIARGALLATLSTLSYEVNQGASGVPNILNLSLRGIDTDYLVALLDEAGFAVSTKSACETDSDTGSRAVLSLTGDAERARSTLRISWGPETRKVDLVRFGKALVPAVEFLTKS